MEPIQPSTQPPLQTPPEIITPKPNYLKTTIFSILGITLLTATIFLFFQNQKLQKQVLNPPISPTIQVPSPIIKKTTLISVPLDETTSWKIYTNNLHGFSLKSPNQLEEINFDGSVTDSNKTYLTKQFTDDVVVRIIYGWTKEKINPYNTANALSEQIIGGVKWYRSYTENTNEPGCYTDRSQTLTSDQKILSK